MRYFLKPVAWNTSGYERPSGAKFEGGFPKENGYGHEEWNNSSRLAYSDGRNRFKVFHTERLTDDLDAYAGRISIILIASNSGRQFAVGVASGCTCLHGDRYKGQRLRLLTKLGLKVESLFEEVWAVENVRVAYDGDKRACMQKFAEEFHWIPNWVCPHDLFLPLEKPVALDPTKITGKKRLVTMFNSYQEIDGNTFRTAMATIASEFEAQQVVTQDFLGFADADLERDLSEINAKDVTTRTALVNARLGQGCFRANLMRYWEGKCAVTGCNVAEMLRASHIQAWRNSSDEERLDPQNGILLCAHLDSLFDSGLISFEDDGSMLLSKRLASAERFWGLGEPLKKRPKGRMLGYLAKHRLSHNL